jgi:hypothetical protein
MTDSYNFSFSQKCVVDLTKTPTNPFFLSFKIKMSDLSNSNRRNSLVAVRRCVSSEIGLDGSDCRERTLFNIIVERVSFLFFWPGRNTPQARHQKCIYGLESYITVGPACHIWFHEATGGSELIQVSVLLPTSRFKH